jgi:hypothetical protein
MMRMWWEILLWVVAVFGLCYLIGYIFVLTALFNFKKRLQKRIVALSVVFADKKEVLLSLLALFYSLKIPLDDPDNAEAEKVRWLKTKVVKGSDIESVFATLSGLEKRLALLAQQQPSLQKNKDYRTYASTLGDLDANYRRIVAVYDSDVTGYNYWCHFLPYFPLNWLFGFRAKKRLA